VLGLPLPAQAGRAEALGWPRRPIASPAAPALGVAAAEHVREVAPPGAVQQLREALAERQPRLRIVSPAAEAMLPAGPWTLRLQVEDWPLVDGGALGLGPHLLVAVDDGEPLPLTSTETTLPELSPGSHRLTVMAARPWGEVVKSPGAMAQVRLHRTAANPLTLPGPGTAQLLAVSPGAAGAEPLLIDWLLIDAPLQHLRDDDALWRLRLTLNGDSFLVDRQTPLWLRGWRPGANALQLELLDGRGEPLNPPFNSLVREVRLDPSLPQPAWQGPPLSPSDLAILLGEAPPSVESATLQEPSPAPLPPPLPAPAPSAESQAPGESPALGESQGLEESPAPEEPQPGAQPAPETAQPAPETGPSPGSLPVPEPAPEPEPAPLPEPALPPAPPLAEPAEPPVPELPVPSPDPEELPPMAASEAGPPPPIPAREEVNADGTLRRDPSAGPLAAWRERLAR
jgi:hypothetical protein